MRISIAYPPIYSRKGTPLLSQNRQFQYFNSPTYVYPVVLASAATLLKSKGFEVSWNDGIASGQTYTAFVEEIERTQPDLMAIESKTPVIKKSWRHVNDLKERFPTMKIALLGDHVSALPEESFLNSAVDFVIKGGDYDWQLLALGKHLEVGDALAPGVYYRAEGKVKKSDGNMVWGNLDDLPMVDRELTKWRMYAYRNGNFRYLPGTYTMVSRDCFPAGTLIETSEGQVPVEHLHMRHWARTHLGNYGQVVSHWARQAPQSLIIKPYCNPAVQVTPEHPFFTQRGWVKANELTKQDWLAFPLHLEEKDTDQLMGLPTSKEDMWFYGLYVAEGYLAQAGRNQMTITLGQNEEALQKELQLYCQWRNYQTRTRWTATAIQINISGGVTLSDGLKGLFGLGAHKKGIHPAILLLPRGKLLAFLGGYIAGDGHLTKRGDSLRSVTVSKRLSYDLRNILLRCGVIASISKDGLYASERFGRVIQGKWQPYRLSVTSRFRAIWEPILTISFSTIRAQEKASAKVAGQNSMNIKALDGPTWQLAPEHRAPSFSAIARQARPWSTEIELSKQLPHELRYQGKVTARLSNTHVYYRVRDIVEGGPVEVFNFSVEGDHSYLADGLAVHNCWYRRPSGQDEEGNYRQGGCTFCSWTSIYPTWRTQSVDRLLDEIGYLIALGVREVFDDAGTFPVGAWLEEFCVGMIKRGYNKKISFSCNMRAGALTREQYQLMGRANFRFLLYGLESASEETLMRINKGVTTKQMEESFRWASEAGCQPHATCMVGYPWESYDDAKATVDFTTRLFRQGYIKTLQATIVIPYPGTELFRQCEENGWLLTRDWNEYDMRQPVMKSALTAEQALGLTRSIYRSALTPEFIWREIMSIRRWDDVKYYGRAGRKFIGHLLDFGAKNKEIAEQIKERVSG